LGLFNEDDEDESLIEELLDLMKMYSADFTNTFRALTLNKLDEADLFSSTQFSNWNEKWQARLDKQQESKELSQELMRNNNPSVIPRNHRVEAALEAAEKGDLSVMEKLLKALSSPFSYSLEQAEYCNLPEDPDRPYRTFCGT
jgi:uncharacterized protein YdiU (UPF0061 family)